MSSKTGKLFIILLGPSFFSFISFRDVSARVDLSSYQIFFLFRSVLLSANYSSRYFDADGREIISKNEVC